MLAELLRLPVEERAKLALALLRSLEGDPEPGAAEAWDAEIPYQTQWDEIVILALTHTSRRPGSN